MSYTPKVISGTYTPTGTWTTNTSYIGYYEIEQTTRGPMLSARILINFTGAPDTGSLDIVFTPPGYAVDDSTRGFLRYFFGMASLKDDGVGYRGMFYLENIGSNSFRLNQQNTTTSWSQFTRTSPITIGAGDTLHIAIDRVPIRSL